MLILNGDELLKWMRKEIARIGIIAIAARRKEDRKILEASVVVLETVKKEVDSGSFAAPPGAEYIRGVEACQKIIEGQICVTTKSWESKGLWYVSQREILDAIKALKTKGV